MQRVPSFIRATIVVTGVLLVVGFLVVASTLGRSSEWHKPDEYASLRSSIRTELTAHFPAMIPAHATGVRIFYPVGGFPPPQDRYLELRLMLPPSEALFIADRMKAAAQSIVDPETNSSLLSIDDMNMSTPLTAGFQRFVLISTVSGDTAGATINTTTGEVVYWCMDL